MRHEPLQFRLDKGLDTYNPALQAKELQFFRLMNVEPRLGRLMASTGFSVFQNLSLAVGDTVIDFGYYSLPNRKFINFYVFTRTKMFRFNFDTQLFETTPIYDEFFSSDEPYVILPWYDALYVTKRNCPLIRVERDTVTVVEDGFYAKYGIIANSHLYFGAVGNNLDDYLARLRWSDRDLPEGLLIDPNESEADFFDLEPDSQGITGVSYQRGSPVVYCENGIWIGRDVGFPGGFAHEPLIPGIGNIFHHAVVRNKEIDFFIGRDNFYALNGLQLVPLGDLIFERFIGAVQKDETAYVRGYLDSRKHQVFWVYKDTNDDLQCVVFNYKENKWSERDPQNLSAFYDTPRIAMRGYNVIDSYSNLPADLIDSASAIIDDPDAGFPVVLPQFVGTVNADDEAIVGAVTDEILKVDETPFAHTVETHDFYFDEIGKVNEITRLLLEFVGDGDVGLVLNVGTRKNQATAITWSANIDLDKTTNANLAFYFRRYGMGRYIRFRFQWENETDDNIMELLLLSIIEVLNDDTVEE